MVAQHSYDRHSYIKQAAAAKMEEECYQEIVVAVPGVYVQMLKGDARAALFLSQVRFHQGNMGDNDGWFWHTGSQWEDELGYSSDAESRCCATLETYGLETMVRTVNRTPKKHYRINESILQKRIEEFLHFRETQKCKKQNRTFNKLDSIPSNIIDISVKAGNVDVASDLTVPISEKPRNHTSEKPQNDDPRNPEITLPRNPENILRDKLLRDLDLRDQNLSETNVSGASVITSGTSVSLSSQKKGTKKRALNDDQNVTAQKKISKVPKQSSPEENAFRAACFSLVRAKYGNNVEGEREAGAIGKMFKAGFTIEEVTECWNITLLDQRWDTYPLSFTWLANSIRAYRDNPEHYKAGMLRNSKQKGSNNGYSTKTTIGEAPKDQSQYRKF